MMSEANAIIIFPGSDKKPEASEAARFDLPSG